MDHGGFLRLVCIMHVRFDQRFMFKYSETYQIYMSEVKNGLELLTCAHCFSVAIFLVIIAMPISVWILV